MVSSVGWAQFEDDALIYVGKVAGEGNGGGLQFFVNRSDIDAGKVFYDLSSVMHLQ